MEYRIFAKVGAFFGKEYVLHLIFSLLFSFILVGCASSDVSRDVTSNIDVGVQNAKNLAYTNTEVGDTYQNTSQATKGAILGGAAGAVTGSLYSGLGILPGTAIGAVLGASYGSYIDSNTSLRDKIINRGGNIVVLGDQVLIVIQSSRIFHARTALIKPVSFSTLDLIAQFINQYTKTLVKVAAYTDDTGSREVDFALSQQQADSIVKYLTETGVDARLLYAVGCGGTHLVSRNTLNWDGSDNYRIEITFEKLYV